MTIPPFLANYWWAILASAIPLLWLWRSLRRLASQAPEELPPWLDTRYRPLTAVSPVRNVVGVIVLVGLLSWGGYQVVRRVRESRADCAQRYAAARTAADTISVDELPSCRSFRER